MEKHAVLPPLLPPACPKLSGAERRMEKHAVLWRALVIRLEHATGRAGAAAATDAARGRAGAAAARMRRCKRRRLAA